MSRKAGKCFVPGCEKRVNDPSLSFFSIPKDKARAEKWITILKLQNKKLSLGSVVCQNHFSRNQFTSPQKTHLNKSAIPYADDQQPHKDLTTQTTTTQRSSVPHLTSSRKSIAEKIADLQKKTLYVRLTRLKLPLSTNGKGNTVVEHVIRSSTKRQNSSTNSNSCIIKRCILCPNPTVAEMGQNNEDCKEKWKNLRLILCRILNLQNKSFSDIPFCKQCEERVEEFEKIYMELKVLELRVEKEIEKFKRDFISVCLKRKTNVFSRGNASKSVVDAILSKWKPENCSKKAKPNLVPPQQANNITTSSIGQIIVLPVGFSLQNLNSGVPSSSSVAINGGLCSSSAVALNPGISSTSPFASNLGIPSTSSTPLNPGISSGSLFAIQPVPLNTLSGKQNDTCSEVETPKLQESTEYHVTCSSLAQNSRVVNKNDLKEVSIKNKSTVGGEGFREISNDEFVDDNDISNDDVSTAQSICDENDFYDNSQAKPTKQLITPPGYVRKVPLLRCPICPAILKRTLKEHLARHKAEARYECYDCDEKFNTKKKLLSHQRLVHGYKSYNLGYDKYRYYNCKLCQKPGLLHNDFLRHIKQIHLDKDATDSESLWFYDCDAKDCKNSFSNQSLLKDHLLRDHNISAEMSECEVCTRLFCVKEKFDIHQTAHSFEPQIFPCNYCYRVFASELELNKHLPRHQILFQLSKFHVCERCGNTFLNRENLSNHRNRFCKLIPESQKKIGKPPQSRYGVKYACKICGKKYCRTRFKLHEYLHTHPEGFKCSHCTHVATNPYSLLDHNRRSHLNHPVRSKRLSEIKLRKYKCEHCSIDPLRSQSRFLRHIKTVHFNKDIVDRTPFWFYYCDIDDCKVSCSSQSELKDHLVKSHELELSDLHECDICERFFCVKENLEMHKKCHSEDDAVFSCNYCSTVFTCDADLEKHTQNHLVIFQLSRFAHTCELCGEGFVEMAQLYSHRNKNKSTGRDCRNLKYNTAKAQKKKETLKNSVQKPKKTKKLEKRNRKPMVYNKSSCAVCGQKLFSSNMVQHMYKHTHPEGFKCASCDHISLTPRLLKMHEIRVHPKHPDIKSNYICEYCHKMSATPKDLKIHKIRYHPQEFLQGRVPCIVCHAIFDSAELMDVHFQDKHQDKICLVEGCVKKFADKHSVTRHRRTHTGEKPFVCSHCKESFGDETTIQYHINTRHTFHRSFLCKLCPDNPGFYERRTFYKHVSTHHPEMNPADILQHNYLKRKFVLNYHADYGKNRRSN